MAFDRLRPYNDLPPLPPRVDLETREVLRRCVSASRALAELKGAGDLIPNQEIPINTIPLQEAKSSSAVENILTTNDRMLTALVGKYVQVDHETKEVLRYRSALSQGVALLATRPLSTNLIVDVCSTLLDRTVRIRKMPGTTISNAATGEVVYTPPEGESVVRDKLADLERYINVGNNLDPLIRLALFHYQFEAIHPFSDGNGRAGRILNILYLISAGLLSIPVLYLSRYIIRHKDEYYSLLQAVTEKGAWGDWVLYMLEAVEETSRWTCGKVRAIEGLLDRAIERCRSGLPGRVYSKELVELVFANPYSKIASVVEAGIAERQTAGEYLSELVKIGLLVDRKVGRERIFINHELVDLLAE